MRLYIPAAGAAALQTNLRFILPAVLAGLIVDLSLGAGRRRLGRRGTAIVAAAITPMAYFALYFVALASLGLLDWSIHLWLGSIVLAGVIGSGIGWLVTRPRVTDPQIAERPGRPGFS